MDICLDTYPYTGGTTTYHAPVDGSADTDRRRTNRRQRGKAPAIMGQIGLDGFTAADDADFVEKGIYWADHLAAFGRACAQACASSAGNRRSYSRTVHRRCVGTGTAANVATLVRRSAAGVLRNHFAGTGPPMTHSRRSPVIEIEERFTPVEQKESGADLRHAARSSKSSRSSFRICARSGIPRSSPTGGPFHQQLEQKLCEYLGVKHIALFTNGTIGLVTALQALRISGEVITTPYSFVATAHSLLWNGIKAGVRRH